MEYTTSEVFRRQTTFSHVTTRNETQKKCFKSVQTDLLKTTLFQHELLPLYKFKFILLCQPTQDALKNRFSHVRATNPVLRALEFKVTLWLIMTSQFFQTKLQGKLPDRRHCWPAGVSRGEEGSVKKDPWSRRRGSVRWSFPRWQQNPSNWRCRDEIVGIPVWLYYAHHEQAVHIVQCMQGVPEGQNLHICIYIRSRCTMNDQREVSESARHRSRQ